MKYLPLLVLTWACGSAAEADRVIPEGAYLEETPLFDLVVAREELNALRPGAGDATVPTPPMQPDEDLPAVEAGTAPEVEAAANEGGVDITLTADVHDLVRIDRAENVVLRMNGHFIQELQLTHFEDPTAARRVKIVGPGGFGQVSGNDRFGDHVEDITFVGVWISGALASPQTDGGLGMCGRRIAFLYVIGRGHGSDPNNAAWSIIAPWNQDCSDIVFYGCNIEAGDRHDPIGEGDNWAVRASHVQRYWIVDSRIQANTLRQGNRFYDLTNSVPGYTTPGSRGGSRHTTFVNTYQGHAMASIGIGDGDFNDGIYMKSIRIVSAQRGGMTTLLFGPHPSYDEGTWVIEGMDVVTDDGHLSSDTIASMNEWTNGEFDLDFGGSNTYTSDPAQVDPFAANTNWPDVVSPTVGLVGSDPFADPPWRD